MNQTSLNFESARESGKQASERCARARRTDPETSKAAARRAADFSESHAGRILLALQRHGWRSPKELEQLVGLSVVQIDRRTVELQRLGLIEVCKNEDGSDMVRGGCRVWKAIR